MPLPVAAVAGLAAGGAELIGSGINALTQGAQNRKNREFTREMYARTRADNIMDWHMQNRYNSPQEQMRRLKEAGLNPNLVYGQGAVANSSSLPKQGEVSNQNLPPVQIDTAGIGNGINTYFNVQQAQQDIIFKKQQTDNLKKQNELMDLDKNIKQYQAIESMIRGEKGKVDLSFSKDTYQDRQKWYSLKNQGTEQSIQQQKKIFPVLYKIKEATANQILQNVRESKQRVAFSKAENTRQQQMQPLNMLGKMEANDQAKVKTLLYKRQYETEQSKKDLIDRQIFKVVAETMGIEFANKLREQGIEKGDNILLRMLVQGFN